MRVSRSVETLARHQVVLLPMEVSRKRTQRRASVLVPHLAEEVLDCPPLELRRDDLDIPDVRVLREERFQRVLDVRVLFELGEGRGGSGSCIGADWGAISSSSCWSPPSPSSSSIPRFAVLQYMSGYIRIQHIPLRLS